MRERTTAIGRLVSLVLTTAIFIFMRPVQDNARKALNVEVIKPAAVAAQVTPSATNAQPVAVQAHAEQQPAPPPPPATWATVTSPNGNSDYVNQALAHYQSMGLTKQGAAMLVGNYLQEMPYAFTTGDPCGGPLGDNGLANGLGQWHPGRRGDMPCGFTEQLTWAVDTEMARDGGGQALKPLLFDGGATADQIDDGIRQWERYGTKGNRYEYGVSLLNQL